MVQDFPSDREMLYITPNDKDNDNHTVQTFKPSLICYLYVIWFCDNSYLDVNPCPLYFTWEWITSISPNDMGIPTCLSFLYNSVLIPRPLPAYQFMLHAKKQKGLVCECTWVTFNLRGLQSLPKRYWVAYPSPYMACYCKILGCCLCLAAASYALWTLTIHPQACTVVRGAHDTGYIGLCMYNNACSHRLVFRSRIVVLQCLQHSGHWCTNIKCFTSTSHLGAAQFIVSLIPLPPTPL